MLVKMLALFIAPYSADNSEGYQFICVSSTKDWKQNKTKKAYSFETTQAIFVALQCNGYIFKYNKRKLDTNGFFSTIFDVCAFDY